MQITRLGGCGLASGVRGAGRAGVQVPEGCAPDAQPGARSCTCAELRAMSPLWVLLALSCLPRGSGVDLQPQLASVSLATNNPTLTTVALEKPLCVFDSAAPLPGAFEVFLYVLVDSERTWNASVLDSSGAPLTTSFQQTEGGRTGPYKAFAFALEPCRDLPSLEAAGDPSQAPDILSTYLIRVGDDGTCLSDPNFQGLCNPPLSGATEYRFKYVLVNTSSGQVQEQTLWSDPIRTSRLSPYSAIDTWPGRRSGSMIVITSILGSLPFFLLVAFTAVIILSFLDVGGFDGETTHDSQVTQEATPKTLGATELPYPSATRGPALDRPEVYASKLPD